jgi:hypothetical protein
MHHECSCARCEAEFNAGLTLVTGLAQMIFIQSRKTPQVTQGERISRKHAEHWKRLDDNQEPVNPLREAMLSIFPNPFT